MRRSALAVLALLVAGIALGGDTTRTLSFSKNVEGIQAVVLEAGVGDVEILAGREPGVTAEVTLSASKKSWGASRARRELDALELDAEVRSGTLYLRVSGDHGGDHNYGEDWSIQVPATVSVSVELGVGEVTILDVEADVDVELGVGDVRIEGDYAAAGNIRGSCGVGDVDLRTPEGRQESEGFVGHSLSASGPGKHEIRVKTGVGDINIRLR
jgi:hypothetical protein